jgi:hypothetical protein
MPGARMGMSGLGGLDLGKLGVGAGRAAAASELEDDEFDFGAPCVPSLCLLRDLTLTYAPDFDSS